MQKREFLAETALHAQKKNGEVVRPDRNPGNQAMLSQLGRAMSMPAPVQDKMEESFGADFSGVKLYESPVVSENGAEAVASGKNIAFAPGQLDLGSRKGLGLLGHELSHVASQARGEVAGTGFVKDTALEHQADAEGDRAASAFDGLSGQTLTPLSAAPAAVSSAGPMQARKRPEEAAPANAPYKKQLYEYDDDDEDERQSLEEGNNLVNPDNLAYRRIQAEPGHGFMDRIKAKNSELKFKWTQPFRQLGYLGTRLGEKYAQEDSTSYFHRGRENKNLMPEQQESSPTGDWDDESGNVWDSEKSPVDVPVNNRILLDVKSKTKQSLVYDYKRHNKDLKKSYGWLFRQFKKLGTKLGNAVYG